MNLPLIFNIFIFIDSSRFVKKLLEDFWESTEISDYTDYQTITQIRNIPKLTNICVIIF